MTSGMNEIAFVTANRSKHAEVQRLLAGVKLRWERLDLARPATDDLAAIARPRVTEAYRRLGVPCFLENTGLWLWEHGGAPGASFKKTWRELGEAGFAARYGGAHGMARVVVAYAASESDVRTFEGHVAGTLLREPRGEPGFGWDRLWVPDGYDRTLGELRGSTYVVNMRAAPYLELGELLRGHVAPSVFEAHVTVAPCELAPFRAACAELGVKSISIELPVGETKTQPMTGSFHRGEMLDVQREVMELARELVRRGFDVTRVKIEAHGKLAFAPETDEAARAAPATSYFEYHLKLALGPEVDVAALGERLRRVGAHLSRNAHKAPDERGTSERFVTLRAHGVGRNTAEERFAAIVALVESEGLVIRNRIREYTVFDTNVALDRGWIE